MKWSKLINELMDAGYIFYKHGKKHDLYKNPANGHIIPVERHGSQEVATGLYHSINKAAGLK